MSSANLIRQLPPGAIAILAILAGTIVAQVVPTSKTKDQPTRPELKSAVPARPAPVPPPVAPQHNEDDQMEALIAQSLDQKTDLEIQNAPIREAFQALGEKTGVPVEFEQGVFDLLPYGSKTRVSTIVIKNRPLRDSLTALIRPVGLKFEVQDNHLAIRPTSPLRRVARRATWEELGLLDKLFSTPWSEEFIKSLKLQFQDLATATDEANRETLLKLARTVGQGSAANVLEEATGQHGWTWYPSGQLVVILPKTKQIERQLEKRISADYLRKNIKDVLLDLALRSGITLHFDPGALTTLPPEMADEFSFSVRNTPIRQVLEIIAGQTGLVYRIEPDGIRISGNPQQSVATTQPSNEAAMKAILDEFRKKSVIGQIVFPGANGEPAVSVIVRPTDTPEDLKARQEMLRQKVREMTAAAPLTAKP